MSNGLCEANLGWLLGDFTINIWAFTITLGSKIDKQNLLYVWKSVFEYCLAA
jgi:hypothetical protein